MFEKFVNINSTQATIVENDYISLTCTRYNNGVNTNEGMSTWFYMFNVKENRVNIIGDKVNYDSQYPVGAYDLTSNSLYYSGKDLSGRHADELLSLNLETGHINQLTNEFFAINYIQPHLNKIYLVAVKKNTRFLKLSYYDIQKQKLLHSKDEKNDKDLCVQYFLLNNYTNKIYTSSYSYKEQESNRDYANEHQTHFEPGLYRIMEYNYALNEPKEIYREENKYIKLLGFISQDRLIFRTTEGFYGKSPEFYEINIVTKEKKKFDLTMFKSVSNIFYHKETNKILVLGTPTSIDSQNARVGRGLYELNLQDKTTKDVLVGSEIAFINNAFLVSY